MRKIIVLEHISLDGVIQAPGGPDEDTSDGFAYGGRAAPYDDDNLGAALQKQTNMPFDLLLGRKTFDIWAAFWPQHADWFQREIRSAVPIAHEHRARGAKTRLARERNQSLQSIRVNRSERSSLAWAFHPDLRRRRLHGPDVIGKVFDSDVAD